LVILAVLTNVLHLAKQLWQRCLQYSWSDTCHTEHSSLSTMFDLTLWRPLLLYEYSYKASGARPGGAVICNFWHPGTL